MPCDNDNDDCIAGVIERGMMAFNYVGRRAVSFLTCDWDQWTKLQLDARRYPGRDFPYGFLVGIGKACEQLTIR